MNQRETFLRQIVENPDEDGPRLLYADWLNEKGHPRREFIRVQCDFAKSSRFEQRYYDLRDRADDLLEKSGQTWVNGYRPHLRPEFHRGFMHSVEISGSDLVNATDLLRTQPVNHLVLKCEKDDCVNPACAALEYVRSLELDYLKIPAEQWIAFLESHCLRNLHALKLPWGLPEYTADIGHSVGRCAAAPKLRSVEIGGPMFVPDADDYLAAFCSGDGFPNLEHLSIGGYYNFGQRFTGLELLKVPRLTSLRIGGDLSTAACKQLSTLPLSQLKQLRLFSSHRSADGLHVLADRGAFDALELLDLFEVTLADGGFEAIFRGQQLAHCTTLIICPVDKSLGSKFVQTLSSGRSLPALKALSLVDMSITERDIEELAQGPLRESLRFLRMPTLNFPARAMRAFRDLVFP